jgi:hypothetical protein
MTVYLFSLVESRGVFRLVWFCWYHRLDSWKWQRHARFSQGQGLTQSYPQAARHYTRIAFISTQFFSLDAEIEACLTSQTPCAKACSHSGWASAADGCVNYAG